MSAPAVHGYASTTEGPAKGLNSLPRSQRFLRKLPTPFLKLSTSSWIVNAGQNRANSPKQMRSRSRLDLFRNSSEISNTGTSPRVSFGQLRAAMTGTRKGSTADELQMPAANIDDVVLSSIPDDEAIADFTASNLHETHAPQLDVDRPPTPIRPTLVRPPSDEEMKLERQKQYDAALTPAIWELATKNANPTVDLLVCLERNQSIGFRYADVDLNRAAALGKDVNMSSFDSVGNGYNSLSRTSTSAYGSGSNTPLSRTSTNGNGNGNIVTLNGINAHSARNGTAKAHNGSTRRAAYINGNGSPASSSPQPPSHLQPQHAANTTRIIIHHGSKDTRVPLENVKWLARTMKDVELRVIEGEGHGLMSVPGVMGAVLSEMAGELEGRGE